MCAGNVDCMGEGPGGTPGCPENKMFDGQAGFQVFLLLVAFVSVPVMLFPKPYILKARHEAKKRGETYGRIDHVQDGDDDSGGGHGHGDGDEFDFVEILVHQMIHTIEFVLGAISNTASYLRLWALSLAHAQLSSVFWERVLLAGVTSGNPVGMVVAVAVWVGATFGVLMMMESLSAFLHALRLHWVEYQNKFYAGDGHKFSPFNLKDIQGEES